MRSLNFETWDIFTDTRFCGNPLAVIFGADDLDTEEMQKIAREFNLSETTFVSAVQRAEHTATVRIFTPEFELPFAGHPVVGTALALARRHELGGDILFDLPAGVFPVSIDRGAGRAAFESPNLPEETGPAPDPALIADALSLTPERLDSADHKVRRCGTGGVDYIYVRGDGDMVRAARLNPARYDALDLEGAIGLFLYSDNTVAPGHDWHARMFAPSAGVPEDPATGSASCAFPAQLALAGALGSGEHSFTVEQGYEMGRPSQIQVETMIADGKVSRVRIGGAGVPVSSGTLNI